MSYSQGAEETVILSYFDAKGVTKGTAVDIGANDGKTFSNSLALIERGWGAILFEPHPTAFRKLESLHMDSEHVMCINEAIGAESCEMVLHCNTPHIEGDTGLLSSLSNEETKRWRDKGIHYMDVKVDVSTWSEWFDDSDTFDFITIDAEGMDYAILSQIDLNVHKVQMVCIEYNSNSDEYKRMTEYCNKFGLKEIFTNAENIIFAR